jgi:hypothetical protein
MPKLHFKHEKGALHIGGGRIFFPGQPLDVTEEEKEELLARFPDDLEEKVAKPKKPPKGHGEGDADTGTAEKS